MLKTEFLVLGDSLKKLNLLCRVFSLRLALAPPEFNSDLQSSIFYSIYINGLTDVCLYVAGCLLVCGGLMEIQTPAWILIKFSTHIPTCSRMVLVQFWTRPPHPPGPRGPETLEAEWHIIENCLQNKRCSAGCKLTRAALDALASYK